jgi:hypothetical protein
LAVWGGCFCSMWPFLICIVHLFFHKHQYGGLQWFWHVITNAHLIGSCADEIAWVGRGVYSID